VQGDGSAATAMLGLAGFVLPAVSEYAGECEQAVETVESVVGCPGCGVLARLHDRRPTWVQDLLAGGRPVVLVWVKRVWRCVEPACATSTWTETSEAIRPWASMTERARAEACRRVGHAGEHLWRTFLHRLIARLNPARRARAASRVIKRKMPKWHVKRAHHTDWPQPAHLPDYTVRIPN